MENKTNKIITLKDDTEYAVLRHIIYKGQTYYLASKLIPGTEDLEEKFILLEVNVKDGTEYVKVSTDIETFTKITESIIDTIED